MKGIALCVVQKYYCILHMFEKLNIRGFQSHKHSILKFVQGVNVIVGESDSGKSAIIRALIWLFTNRPPGNSFLTHGAKSTRVTLGADDHTLSKTKGKGKTKYEIDELSLEAMGQNIPEQMIEAICIKSEVNFMRQLDPPFLLSESPGEVSRQLNNVASLQIIDKVLNKVNSTRLQTTNNYQNAIEEVEALGVELSEYKNLRQIEQKVESAEFNLQNVERLQRKCLGLENIIQSLEEAEALKQNTINKNTLDKAKAIIKGLEKDMVERSRIVKRTQSLYKLIEGIEDSELDQKTILSSQKELAALYKKLMPDECPLCGRSG